MNNETNNNSIFNNTNSGGTNNINSNIPNNAINNNITNNNISNINTTNNPNLETPNNGNNTTNINTNINTNTIPQNNDNNPNLNSTNSNITNNTLANNNIESSNPNTSTNKHPKKKNKIFLIILIVIVIIIGIIGFLYYRTINNINVFKEIINNSFNYLESNINNSDTYSGNFSLNINGSSTDSDTNDFLELLSKIDISGTYGIDYNNKIMNIDIESNYDNSKLINTTVYVENNNAYLYLDDIYDKYIMTNLDEYGDYFETTNKDDYKVILNSLKTAINESLKDEYFTITSDKIDGKSVKKSTLNLDKETYINIKTDIINSLLEDNEFLESISSINSEDNPEDIKEYLNEQLNSNNDDVIDTEISIYTTAINYNFVKLIISNEEREIIVTNDNNKYNYELIEDNNTINSGYISIDENNNTTVYDFSLTDNTEEFTFGFTLTNTINNNTEINKLDVSNAVNYEDITDSDYTSIYFKLLSNEGVAKLISEYLDTDL